MRYNRWLNPNRCPGYETCIWFCAKTQTCDFCYITHKRRGCAPDENCTRYLPLPRGNFDTVKHAISYHTGRGTKMMQNWLDRNLDVTLTAAGQPPEDTDCRVCDVCGEALEDKYYEGEEGCVCAACARESIENALDTSFDQIAEYCGFRVCHGEEIVI